MTRIYSDRSIKRRRQESPEHKPMELGPVRSLVDRSRTALIAAGTDGNMTWTEVDRALSAVRYFYDESGPLVEVDPDEIPF